MPFLNLGDTEIYYELHGSGSPLMLVAGLASDSQSWQPVLAGLSEHFTVILTDNRGTGRSSGNCDVTVRQMADDCITLLKSLGFEKVNLLGHSMGGMIAQECAVRYPEMIDNLFLVATAMRNSARNNILLEDWAYLYENMVERAVWFRMVFSWIFTKEFFADSNTIEESVRYLLACQRPQTTESFRSQVKAIADFDSTCSAGMISSPTTVIAGEEDILMPVTDSAAIASAVQGSRFVVIKGAAHSVHVEKPEEFVRAVIASCYPEKDTLI